MFYEIRPTKIYLWKKVWKGPLIHFHFLTQASDSRRCQSALIFRSIMSSLLVEVIGKGRSSLIRRTFPLSVSLQIFLHIDPKYSHEKSPKHAKFKILLEICNVHSSRAVCSKCKINLNRLLMASLLLITIIIILIVIRDQGRRR